MWVARDSIKPFRDRLVKWSVPVIEECKKDSYQANEVDEYPQDEGPPTEFKWSEDRKK